MLLPWASTTASPCPRSPCTSPTAISAPRSPDRSWRSCPSPAQSMLWICNRCAPRPRARLPPCGARRCHHLGPAADKGWPGPPPTSRPAGATAAPPAVSLALASMRRPVLHTRMPRARRPLRRHRSAMSGIRSFPVDDAYISRVYYDSTTVAWLKTRSPIPLSLQPHRPLLLSQKSPIDSN
jgi:hypothetical protein